MSHPVDRAFREMDRAQETKTLISTTDKDCQTVYGCTVLGGIVGTALPTPGGFAIGMAVGAFVGLAIEGCKNCDKKK